MLPLTRKVLSHRSYLLVTGSFLRVYLSGNNSPRLYICCGLGEENSEGTGVWDMVFLYSLAPVLTADNVSCILAPWFWEGVHFPFLYRFIAATHWPVSSWKFPSSLAARGIPLILAELFKASGTKMISFSSYTRCQQVGWWRVTSSISAQYVLCWSTYSGAINYDLRMPHWLFQLGLHLSQYRHFSQNTHVTTMAFFIYVKTHRLQVI